MTAQVWIDSTRDMLLSGYVEELDLVTTAPSPATTGTTLVVQGIATSIVKGVVIEVNAELMYVISVSSTTINVMRGYGGSTAATHATGDIVRVSPKFPTNRIISSLNDDLADLSAPGQGLFQMKTTSFTYNAGVDGYDLAGLTSAEIDSIYSVTYADIGTEAAEPDVSSWRLRRNRDTASFSSGLALILYTGAWPGQKITVMYKSPFTPITDGTTARSAVGLATTAYDLPPLGAAMALMTTTPIRREFLDAQGTSRMADEVPPGAISASFRDLMGRRRARVEAESGRLVSQYPQLWTRNSAMRPTAQWSGFTS
jgi:hypothetical protein